MRSVERWEEASKQNKLLNGEARNGSRYESLGFHVWARSSLSNAHTRGMYDVVRRTPETLLVAISEMHAWRPRTLHHSYERELQPLLPAPTTMSRRIQSLRGNDQPSAIAELRQQLFFINRKVGSPQQPGPGTNLIMPPFFHSCSGLSSKSEELEFAATLVFIVS
jgi:hypothetical protein